MSSIKNVVNEPIEGHEEYHMIVGFYLKRTYIARSDNLLLALGNPIGTN